jgi:hypothetical protein
MATTDQIFFRTGLSPVAVAQRLAESLELTLSPGTPDPTVGGSVPGSTARSGGIVTTNYLANEPGEPSIVDYYDVIWSIRSNDHREATVFAESTRYFDMAIQRLPWPALLRRNLDWLIASWTPEQGRYDFPERTSAERRDMEIWLPHVPT